MIPYIPTLVAIIISNLQDLSAPAKRIASLRALGQIASNTSYVIDPYVEHPELLNILVNIVKTEAPGRLRRETIRLLGILGALDSYRYQQIMEQPQEAKALKETEPQTDVEFLIEGTVTPSKDEYYPRVVIKTLMGLVSDQSLAQYHSAVIDAVMAIYQTMGLKCVDYLPDIIPGFLAVIRTAPPGRVEGYFNQLSQLVRIVRHHIRPYLPVILTAVKNFWKTATIQLQGPILSLIEAIARSLEGEFKVYLAEILPLVLGVLETDTDPRRAPSQRILHTFLVFGPSAEEYVHLIIPAVIKVFDKGVDKGSQPVSIRKQAIETLGRLSRQVNMSEFASQIIQPLCRVLASTETQLKHTALDMLCALIYQLGPDYFPFIPTVQKVSVCSPHEPLHADEKDPCLPEDISQQLLLDCFQTSKRRTSSARPQP